MSPTPSMTRPIAIFDSGIGGLPYYSAARAALPAESFIYIADREGFPYGAKSRDRVEELVLALVSKLVEAFNPKALVIACNTASQAGLAAVRKANPGLSIVGTVPAVKPAAERSCSGVIGVLATAGAVEDPYLDSLVARYAKGVRVLREGAQELVYFVERRAATASGSERREAVFPYVRRFLDGGADEIVLACTHFLHLRDDIAALAGPSVEIVDSRSGVVRRLKQVLGERGLLNDTGLVAGEDLFLLTGEDPLEPEYGLFARSFGLSGPELLRGRKLACRD